MSHDPQPITMDFPPAADEWKLGDKLIEGGLCATVERLRYAQINISPIPGTLFKPEKIRLFVKGYIAGISA